jgi:hypothetical protein
LDTANPPQTSTRPGGPVVESTVAEVAKRNATRRHFMKGTAAVAGGVVAAHYVKPSLRALGVPAALAVSQPGGSQGCTPGFWGNEGVSTAGGRELWNVANDPDWNARRLPGGDEYNPFHWNTLFTDVFASHPDVVGAVMYIEDSSTEGTVDGSGGTAAEKAARHLVAAYLNASFGLDYPFTKAELAQMWANAVANGSSIAFDDLKNLLDTANNLGCVISGSTGNAPASGAGWTGTGGTTGDLEKMVKKPK